MEQQAVEEEGVVVVQNNEKSTAKKYERLEIYWMQFFKHSDVGFASVKTCIFVQQRLNYLIEFFIFLKIILNVYLLNLGSK